MKTILAQICYKCNMLNSIVIVQQSLLPWNLMGPCASIAKPLKSTKVTTNQDSDTKLRPKYRQISCDEKENEKVVKNFPQNFPVQNSYPEHRNQMPSFCNKQQMPDKGLFQFKKFRLNQNQNGNEINILKVAQKQVQNSRPPGNSTMVVQQNGGKGQIQIVQSEWQVSKNKQPKTIRQFAEQEVDIRSTFIVNKEEGYEEVKVKRYQAGLSVITEQNSRYSNPSSRMRISQEAIQNPETDGLQSSSGLRSNGFGPKLSKYQTLSIKSIQEQKDSNL